MSAQLCSFRHLILLVTSSLMLRTTPVTSHGRLMDPPARNSMWRLGFPNPVNYNDNELYCGGRITQWARNHGKCGVCGDPYHQEVKDHEAGGRYANEIITRDYTEGDVIEIVVHITANHKGYFEFRLCPVEDGQKSEVTQACLDRHVLHLANGEGTRYRLSEGKSNDFFTAQYRLPSGLSCKRCVMQWKYRTANTWDKGPDGDYCLGCGPQEEFYNCADVTIHPKYSKQNGGVSDKSKLLTKELVEMLANKQKENFENVKKQSYKGYEKPDRNVFTSGDLSQDKTKNKADSQWQQKIQKIFGKEFNKQLLEKLYKVFSQKENLKHRQKSGNKDETNLFHKTGDKNIQNHDNPKPVAYNAKHNAMSGAASRDIRDHAVNGYITNSINFEKNSFDKHQGSLATRNTGYHVGTDENKHNGNPRLDNTNEKHYFNRGNEQSSQNTRNSMTSEIEVPKTSVVNVGRHDLVTKWQMYNQKYSALQGSRGRTTHNQPSQAMIQTWNDNVYTPSRMRNLPKIPSPPPLPSWSQGKGHFASQNTGSDEEKNMSGVNHELRTVANQDSQMGSDHRTDDVRDMAMTSGRHGENKRPKTPSNQNSRHNQIMSLREKIPSWLIRALRLRKLQQQMKSLTPLSTDPRLYRSEKFIYPYQVGQTEVETSQDVRAYPVPNNSNQKYVLQNISNTGQRSNQYFVNTEPVYNNDNKENPHRSSIRHMETPMLQLMMQYLSSRLQQKQKKSSDAHHSGNTRSYYTPGHSRYDRDGKVSNSNTDTLPFTRYRYTANPLSNKESEAYERMQYPNVRKTSRPKERDIRAQTYSHAFFDRRRTPARFSSSNTRRPNLGSSSRSVWSYRSVLPEIQNERVLHNTHRSGQYNENRKRNENQSPSPIHQHYSSAPHQIEHHSETPTIIDSNHAWNYRSSRRQRLRQGSPRNLLSCVAVIDRGPGMDTWCTDNCNANFCPASVCSCTQTNPTSRSVADIHSRTSILRRQISHPSVRSRYQETPFSSHLRYTPRSSDRGKYHDQFYNPARYAAFTNPLSERREARTDQSRTIRPRHRAYRGRLYRETRSATNDYTPQETRSGSSDYTPEISRSGSSYDTPHESRSNSNVYTPREQQETNRNHVQHETDSQTLLYEPMTLTRTPNEHSKKFSSTQDEGQQYFQTRYGYLPSSRVHPQEEEDEMREHNSLYLENSMTRYLPKNLPIASGKTQNSDALYGFHENDAYPKPQPYSSMPGRLSHNLQNSGYDVDLNTRPRQQLPFTSEQMSLPSKSYLQSSFPEGFENERGFNKPLPNSLHFENELKRDFTQPNMLGQISDFSFRTPVGLHQAIEPKVSEPSLDYDTASLNEPLYDSAPNLNAQSYPNAPNVNVQSYQTEPTMNAHSFQSAPYVNDHLHQKDPNTYLQRFLRAPVINTIAFDPRHARSSDNFIFQNTKSDSKKQDLPHFAEMKEAENGGSQVIENYLTPVNPDLNPLSCRAKGAYAGLSHFDRWCVSTCASSMCPLLICTCEN